MMRLNSIFNGEGYNQVLKLLYDEVLVFNGVADDLVSSASGELRICLTFSTDRKFSHILRRARESIVLLPDIEHVDVNAYLEAVKGVSLVWPTSDLESLWEQLRYDTKEVEKIEPAKSNDLFFIWLISSQYSFIDLTSVSKMANSIKRNILAEDGDDHPSTKNIISQLNNGELMLESIQEHIESDDTAITVYIDNIDDSVVEWNAISSSRDLCLLGNSLALACSDGY